MDWTLYVDEQYGMWITSPWGTLKNVNSGTNGKIKLHLALDKILEESNFMIKKVDGQNMTQEK